MSPSSKIDKETALVIDIGHDITEVTPIHEGFILMHQVKTNYKSTDLAMCS